MKCWYFKGVGARPAAKNRSLLSGSVGGEASGDGRDGEKDARLGAGCWVLNNQQFIVSGINARSVVAVKQQLVDLVKGQIFPGGVQYKDDEWLMDMMAPVFMGN